MLIKITGFEPHNKRNAALTVVQALKQRHWNDDVTFQFYETVVFDIGGVDHVVEAMPLIEVPGSPFVYSNWVGIVSEVQSILGENVEMLVYEPSKVPVK
jgi:hypothetical protein